jgi:hypothetical protein
MPNASLRCAAKRREARLRFASRIKTLYNGLSGGRGNQARLSISFLPGEAAGVSSFG